VIPPIIELFITFDGSVDNDIFFATSNTITNPVEVVFTATNGIDSITLTKSLYPYEDNNYGIMPTYIDSIQFVPTSFTVTRFNPAIIADRVNEFGIITTGGLYYQNIECSFKHVASNYPSAVIEVPELLTPREYTAAVYEHHDAVYEDVVTVLNTTTLYDYEVETGTKTKCALTLRPFDLGNDDYKRIERTWIRGQIINGSNIFVMMHGGLDGRNMRAIKGFAYGKAVGVTQNNYKDIDLGMAAEKHKQYSISLAMECDSDTKIDSIELEGIKEYDNQKL
jgi:hypothetical protein